MSDTITWPAPASPGAIAGLTGTVRGRVVTASDPDSDDARVVYDAMHDRRPCAVVQCTDAADVMAVVAAARDTGLDLAIRGGGHSVPGFGTVDEVGDVVGGPQFYDFDDAAVLECSRSTSARRPSSLDASSGWQIAPALPFIPENRVGDLFYVLVTCWNNPRQQAERVLRPLRDVAEVQAEQVDVMPFPALQSAFDDPVPKGMQNYWKADFATELTDAAIAAHVRHGQGGYINFMSGDDDHRAADNYGANYERLCAVKAAYDPGNLFHVNQNIAPAERG